MLAANMYRSLFFILFIPLSFSSCKETPVKSPVNAATAPSNKQNNLSFGLDKSPMDMIYFPVDYPKLRMSGQATEPPITRVIYSRPKKDGRVIFGNVVKYGSPWRLGANEATEIEFFQNVSIFDQNIPKNRYILYCIPYPDKWTLILNNGLYSWGLKIDSAKDVYKFTVPIRKIDQPLEVFAMEFQSANGMANLVIGWDSVRAMLPIKF